mmetsp:Transcript_15931/g.23440  ORF Transcript_15931/g.23440 Transcript_15931/m.23440 type:complete len:469 (-) Transcript_15931:364-1770(-)|eukprot:CAMPEP_0194223282 /NCGR_PEP_ID=MMETSP0156-20130528/34768_1 /TAXON_ID=33649 /ORGANISM="Thalassionema nitzschioides, Strain L26-B" /LENGTH=468 /DNA_ID=CAMNT_0038954359 /DNA_START=134 /DNA_END=1540 /DNA_ORIENTATION=+
MKNLKLLSLCFFSSLLVASSFLAIPSLQNWRQGTILHYQSPHSTWQTYVSTVLDAKLAISNILCQLSRSNPPEVVFLFVGQTHASSFELIVEYASAALPPHTRLLSVVGGGVIGENIEFDEPTKPSMSILAGQLPEGATIELFSFNELTKPPPPPESEYWSKLGSSSLLILADPWSPVTDILDGLSASTATGKQGKETVVVGGFSMPTGAKPTVALDSNVMPQGSLVGIGFRGTLSLQAVVAQGCQPFGPTYIVTACEKNCVLELDFKPAQEAMEGCIASASKDIEKQRKISSSIVCGVSDRNSQGDYLIRSIVGFVPGRKAFSISGKSLQKGDRIRFHISDKTAATEDLELMVKRAETERLFQQDKSTTPVAAVQVSCISRGRRLFGVPNMDLSKIQQLLSGPVGGFYANGGIGPVGVAGFCTNKNTTIGTHVHGFTTVAALLCESEKQDAPNSNTSPSVKAEDVWG